MNANIAFMKTLSITGEINFIANSMRMKITSKLHCIVSHASSIALKNKSRTNHALTSSAIALWLTLSKLPALH
jgi:hypothetical protein